MCANPNTLVVSAHASDHPGLEKSQMARVRIAAKERDIALVEPREIDKAEL